MKILVPVKRVPDYATKLKVNASGSGYETAGIKWVLNPFDEIAVEEALKIKESGKATEVIVVTIGSADCNQQLLSALALGADRAIHVLHDGEVDSDLASRVLQKIVEKEQPQIILLGKQATDTDSGQTPQLLAARLGIAQACFASKVVHEGTHLLVTREVDGGLETLKVSLPAVVSTDLRLNTPRYASVMGIMKAKKKPLEAVALSSLNVDASIKVKTLRVSAPPQRKAGRMLASVEELVNALKNEAKVI